MKKKIIFSLSWMKDGQKHTRTYDDEQTAILCYSECIDMPGHSDVILTKIISETLATNSAPRSNRENRFAVLTFKNGKRTFFRLKSVDSFDRFKKFLSDPETFSLNFYVSKGIPTFIRRHGYFDI